MSALKNNRNDTDELNFVKNNRRTTKPNFITTNIATNVNNLITFPAAFVRTYRYKTVAEIQDDSNLSVDSLFLVEILPG